MHFLETTPEGLLGALNEVEKKHAPARLFAAGHVDLLRSGARVSIVGSRRASAGGLRRAWEYSESLSRRGVVIVSGLAEGVDTQAHRAAIDCAGKTVAVLGTPLDEFFPAKNRDLQTLIMAEHLCLSQFPSGAPSQRGNFPMRNRTMALISDATLIVEAGEKSGSLHQGWEALRLGRPLFLDETILEDEGLSWPKEMERFGAQVISLSSLEYVFEFLPERTGEQAPSISL